VCVWEYYSVFVKQPDCLLLISSLRYTLDANRIFRMAAAVVGTAVGLYTVVNQDTNHGAEHHPLGDPHGEGGAQKTGTGSTVGEENKQDEPEEETKDESKEESKDESKEEPKSDQQDPSKPTKENSEEKDTQSPDQSDKPDPRKEETKSQNEMSGKQKGLSNDNTEHTSQISKQPEKSKKGEGVAETAKLQGTVSTERPGAENKEERGKAQQDKDA
jgi:outer membrane biosynthesis protein TonB